MQVSDSRNKQRPPFCCCLLHFLQIVLTPQVSFLWINFALFLGSYCAERGRETGERNGCRVDYDDFRQSHWSYGTLACGELLFHK